jgi:hypothetical protein
LSSRRDATPLPSLKELTLHAALFATSRMSASTVSSGLPFSRPAPGSTAAAASSASDSIGTSARGRTGEAVKHTHQGGLLESRTVKQVRAESGLGAWHDRRPRWPVASPLGRLPVVSRPRDRRLALSAVAVGGSGAEQGGPGLPAMESGLRASRTGNKIVCSRAHRLASAVTRSLPSAANPMASVSHTSSSLHDLVLTCRSSSTSKIRPTQNASRFA